MNSNLGEFGSARVAFHTFGCKVNYSETAALREQFRREGFVAVESYTAADICVINTCTVTQMADSKARQLIRRIKRQNPHVLIVACGCFSQVEPATVAAIPGVDFVAGTAERLLLPGLIRRKLQGEDVKLLVKPYPDQTCFEEMYWTPEQGRTRAFLKIQDGCDRYCSYCVVPLARGPLRSLSARQVLANLREIIAAGYREIVLTGIHLGLYGVDLRPPSSLAALLEEAVQLPDLQRIRLSSLEPSDFDAKLISVIASTDKICRHLHIPLQSGDDAILHLMKRQYDAAFFRRLLHELRTAIPDLAISTDIITGFPGEEERHFQISFAFVQECAFSRLHVFPFSLRSGTEAAKLGPAVQPSVKKERSRRMIELGAILSRDFRKGFLGRTMPVLFEKLAGEINGKRQSLPFQEGLTSQYLRVRTTAGADLRGQVRDVLLQSDGGACLYGTIVPLP